MGCYKGHAWVSLGGVGHVELSEGFFGLTVASSVARISPSYRGRNGSLSSIRWKGRFLCEEMQEK